MINAPVNGAQENGMNFTTYDSDNDLWDGNCAIRKLGGWWFNQCGISLTSYFQEANIWGIGHNVSRSRMLIKLN